MWRTSSLVSPASLASPPPLQDQLWEVAPLSQMPLHVHWWVRRAPGLVLPESLISPCSTRVIPAQSSALRPVHAEVRKHSFLLEGGLSQQTPFPDTAGEPAPSGSVPAHAPRLGVPRKGPRSAVSSRFCLWGQTRAYILGPSSSTVGWMGQSWRFLPAPKSRCLRSAK